MKHYCSFLLFLLALSLQAQRIVVKEPGTLHKLIADKKYVLSSLTLEGRLNGKDVCLLREMAGQDSLDQPTSGRLRRVNLEKVTFVPDGFVYLRYDGLQRITSAHALPNFLFRKCPVEAVTLPQQTDTIGTGALEHSNISRIALPENVVLMPYAINHCERLKQVTAPRYAKSILAPNFSECPLIETLHLGDVGNVAAYTFRPMPNVKSISLGSIGHIDGWYTFSDCPQLKEVVFRGAVLTTGGPIMFTRCPELETVTFQGPVYSSGIGAPQGCPKLKKYDTRHLVLRSQTNDSIRLPKTSQKEIEANPARYIDAYQQMQAIASKYEFPLPGSLLLARCYAQTKQWNKAGQTLADAAEKGIYRGYETMKNDSSLYRIWIPAARRNEKVAKALDLLKKEEDYLYILREGGAYKPESQPHEAFRYYMASNDSNLMHIRKYFNLDSIAGTGDEISRIKNLMYWMHDLIPHDGMNGFPPNTPWDLISLYKACKQQNRGLNCRGLALVLTQCYLAMGIPARMLSCLPRDTEEDPDCHVINMVWSRTLNKWIWMDPSFAAYVTDENGTLLHPGEVRERLINKKPLVLNEDANWNHRSKQTKEEYLEYYMAKNLYALQTHLCSGYYTEFGGYPGDKFITLIPSLYKKKSRNPTTDEAYFWQAPQ